LGLSTKVTDSCGKRAASKQAASQPAVPPPTITTCRIGLSIPCAPLLSDQTMTKESRTGKQCGSPCFSQAGLSAGHQKV
jgi:hypothetical protein